jgi:hypothetical protein
MAFALAIQSKEELKDKDVGGTFLFLTIIITLFTVFNILISKSYYTVPFSLT